MAMLKKMFIVSLVVGLGFQGNLLAQRADGEPKGAPTAAEMGQETIAPDKITDAMLDSFVKADRKIREVQVKANQEIFKILDSEGLNVSKYNGIVQAITKDEAILKKVQAKIQAILQKEHEAQNPASAQPAQGK